MSRYDIDSPAIKNSLWNHLHILADAAVMVSDQEQRAKKGKFKAVSEEEEDDQMITLSDHVPKKIRSWLRNPQQNYENPNGASTSSTLPHLLCKMPQRKTCKSKLKKAKIFPLPRAARETPEWLVQVMRNMNGSQDPRLIFERSLSKSDVDSGLSRLLIPFNMLIRNDFLTPAESLVMEREECMRTVLVNKLSENWVLWLNRWAMKKKSGNGTLNYALNRGWNAFVKDNGLKAGDEISLWSFRCGGVLCFALEHRPKSSI